MLYESFRSTEKASGSKMLTNDGLRHEFGDFPLFPHLICLFRVVLLWLAVGNGRTLGKICWSRYPKPECICDILNSRQHLVCCWSRKTSKSDRLQFFPGAEVSHCRDPRFDDDPNQSRTKRHILGSKQLAPWGTWLEMWVSFSSKKVYGPLKISKKDFWL